LLPVNLVKTGRPLMAEDGHEETVDLAPQTGPSRHGVIFKVHQPGYFIRSTSAVKL